MMVDYEDFLPAQRLGNSISVSMDGTAVAYVSDASGQLNLWTQPIAGGPARQLTSFTGRAVREVAWAPDGETIAFTADTQGDEQYQVYVMPRDGGTPALVSGGTGQHLLAWKAPFGPEGLCLLYSGPDHDPEVPAVIARDLAEGTERRWPGPANTYNFAAGISPDGEHVLSGALASNTKSHCYLAPIAAPGTALEPVTSSMPGEYYYPGPWTGDSTGFYLLTTDADNDHVSLARFCVKDSDLAIVDSPPWDVEDIVVSADGRTAVWSVNQDGYSVLRGERDGAGLRMPPIPGGVITAMSISGDGTVLALRLDTPARPASVVVTYPGTTKPVRYLTDARPKSSVSSEASTPELIRYPTADGTLVPAWVYRPAGPGPHPVLLSVHGGPENQARPEYDALHQCLLARGIAIFAPNIHGSGGYGHAWQSAIYRDWGGTDLRDLAAAHQWLITQPWVIQDKIAVYGASYGGFAALSCLTRLPDQWAAGVSVYGPANLDSLARAMPPSWAAAVAAMFGDPDNPADAGQLRRRSPLTYASQIAAPLLVIQGANDPRVPKTESDQIIAAARANGANARYLVFDDEGHGFTSRANDIKAHQEIAEFLTGQLLT
ncbi:MAG: S9 family peptidase [Streptosporangiaceae bacterium]|nr:S9 family peptidase [Streptosporangiaceae bacterium]